jgi:hypothetical protein
MHPRRHPGMGTTGAPCKTGGGQGGRKTPNYECLEFYTWCVNIIRKWKDHVFDGGTDLR